MAQSQNSSAALEREQERLRERFSTTMFSFIYFIMLPNNQVGCMLCVSCQDDGLVDKMHGVCVCVCGLEVMWGYSILNHPIQKYTAYCAVFVRCAFKMIRIILRSSFFLIFYAFVCVIESDVK